MTTETTGDNATAQFGCLASRAPKSVSVAGTTKSNANSPLPSAPASATPLSSKRANAGLTMKAHSANASERLTS